MRCGNASSRYCHRHPPVPAAASRAASRTATAWPHSSSWPAPPPPWRLLPAKELGCGSATTCWRRLDEWAHAGVFDRLQVLLLDELGAAGRIDLERVSIDSFSLRAVKGGPDRRKPGRSRQDRSKLHLAPTPLGCPCC
jgi:hypothetical protein